MIKNICLCCGKEYEYEPKRGTYKFRYCSDVCRLKYSKEQRARLSIYSKDELESFYIKKNLTLTEMSELLKVDYEILIRRLEELDIKKDPKLVGKNRIKNNIYKYGVSSTSKLSAVKAKTKQTNKEKYGVEHAFQSKEVKQKIKNTNLKRYGVECTFQSPEIKKKIEQTNIERYGTSNTFASPIIKERIRETIKEKYGTEYISQSKHMKDKYDEILAKQYATKNKNHSWCLSKPEIKIKELLEEKFIEVKCQYKTKKYPFNCDFYIPNLNLYIEYQGHWTHGGHAYTGSVEDRALLVKWESKSNKSPLYKKARHIWTILDVHKRDIAKENHLNWIEFFNLKEFLEWYAQFS